MASSLLSSLHIAISLFPSVGLWVTSPGQPSGSPTPTLAAPRHGLNGQWLSLCIYRISPRENLSLFPFLIPAGSLLVAVFPRHAVQPAALSSTTSRLALERVPSSVFHLEALLSCCFPSEFCLFSPMMLYSSVWLFLL